MLLLLLPSAAEQVGSEQRLGILPQDQALSLLPADRLRNHLLLALPSSETQQRSPLESVGKHNTAPGRGGGRAARVRPKGLITPGELLPAHQVEELGEHAMQAREQRLVTATPRCRTGGVLAGSVQHAVSSGCNCRLRAAHLRLQFLI